MSRMLDYFVVDVFTTEAYAGNPLAVVPDADGLSDGDLQRIANEFNLSETAFPMAATVEGASYRLRIFTPTTELPFAGHPSVGAAWVMRSLGRVGDGEVIQECGAGLLPLQLDGDRVTLSGGEPSVSEPVDPAPVLAAVGLAATDFVGDAVRWAGAGLNWGFVHVHPDAVARARPDTAALDAVAAGTGLSVFSYDDGVAHARVFAGGAGVPEDPATGSAALGFGVWLAATGLVLADGVTSYLIEQGVEIGRPSRLECTVRCVDGHPVELAVAGAVVPIAEGRIRVP
ncbi:MAG TPA: PhzF family phenazine biosynthesis protein [Mycobacteriales bacterium]|jgi:trans-2,3-dihydro-3-hydroxyanthranilate isomerase|nr:PhzF family phenazine biosynthesis protein [Mycobacteriales bacterium]